MDGGWVTPRESCTGLAPLTILPNTSGDGLPPMGCWTRTEVTYLERWPYSTSSLLPWIIGEAFSGPGVGGWSACPWASALPDVPNVIPPANAALRRPLRLVLS